MYIRIRWIFLVVLLFVSNVPLSHSMSIDFEGTYYATASASEDGSMIPPYTAEDVHVSGNSPPVFNEMGSSGWGLATATNLGSAASSLCRYDYRFGYMVGLSASTRSVLSFTAPTSVLHLNLGYYLSVYADNANPGGGGPPHGPMPRPGFTGIYRTRHPAPLWTSGSLALKFI